MTANGNDRCRTYAEFWPFYLRQHANRATRLVHVFGTALAALFLAGAVIRFDPVWLMVAPVAGYGFAWFAHAFIEKNRPATFIHPLWSLRGDLQMLWLWLTCRLEAEVRRQRDARR